MYAHTVLFLCLTLALHGQTSVTVELRDGSRIGGNWTDEHLEFTPPQAPGMHLKRDGVWAIARNADNTFTLDLRNGDRLRGTVSSPLSLESRLGKLVIPPADLVSLRQGGQQPILEFDHRFHTEGGRIEFGAVPALDRCTAFTFAGWFHSNRLPGHQGLFALKRDALHFIRANFWHNNRIYVHLSDGDVSYISTEAKVKRDEWFHIAIVYDGSLEPADRIRVFQNGVAQPSRRMGTIPSKTPDFDGASFTIPPEQYGWHGRIRVIQVYDRALPEAEIKRLGRTKE